MKWKLTIVTYFQDAKMNYLKLAFRLYNRFRISTIDLELARDYVHNLASYVLILYTVCVSIDPRYIRKTSTI